MVLEIVLGLIMICITVIASIIMFKIIVAERERDHYKVQLKYLKHFGEVYKNNDSLE